MFVIVAGNIMNGHSFLTGFKSWKEAKEWGEKNIDESKKLQDTQWEVFKMNEDKKTFLNTLTNDDGHLVYG